MKAIRCLLILMLFVEAVFFVYNETNAVALNTLEIKDKKLADAFQGARVMQISDLHIKRPGARENRLKKLIKRA